MVNKVANVLVVYPHDHMADWELQLTDYCSKAEESIIPHIAGPGKDQNSKLEIQFLLNVYCFHTTV